MHVAPTLGVPDSVRVSEPGEIVYVIVGNNIEPEEIIRLVSSAEVWPTKQLPSARAHQMSASTFRTIVQDAFKDQQPPTPPH